jgi:hypothetical protein
MNYAGLRKIAKGRATRSTAESATNQVFHAPYGNFFPHIGFDNFAKWEWNLK